MLISHISHQNICKHNVECNLKPITIHQNFLQLSNGCCRQHSSRSKTGDIFPNLHFYGAHKLPIYCKFYELGQRYPSRTLTSHLTFVNTVMQNGVVHLHNATATFDSFWCIGTNNNNKWWFTNNGVARCIVQCIPCLYRLFSWHIIVSELLTLQQRYL